VLEPVPGPMEWRFAIQEPVGQNRYVPLPSPVRAAVTSEHPLDGECLHWNFEQHSNYVVLSRGPLSKPNYVDVGRYSVYDTDSESDAARIRPPEPLDDVVRSGFVPGGRVTFLAHDEMLGDDPAVYLLSEGQLLELLPGDAAGGDAAPDDVAAALLRTPGFMPA